MIDNDLHNIFDENGQHKLNKFSKKVTTEFNINFLEEKLKVFMIIPKIIKIGPKKSYWLT